MTQSNIDIHNRLAGAGLRPTRQRRLIAAWLFSGEDKHVTAEGVHREMQCQDANVSLATVYNTLGTFTEAGLLHTVSIDAGRVFYDTNTRAHFHLYDERTHSLSDIDASELRLDGLPELPSGQNIERVDVIIRTRSHPNI